MNEIVMALLVTIGIAGVAYCIYDDIKTYRARKKRKEKNEEKEEPPQT